MFLVYRVYPSGPADPKPVALFGNLPDADAYVEWRLRSEPWLADVIRVGHVKEM